MNISKNSRGTAIISALLVLTIALILVSEILLNEQILLRRTQLNVNSLQSNAYAQGVLVWAIGVLQDDPAIFNNTATTSKQIPPTLWPRNLPSTEINGAKISGNIIDAQGRFNLNQLTEKDYGENFIRLLLSVKPNLDRDQAKQIAQAVFVWINSTQAHHAINQIYLQSKPPYQAAGRAFVSISELRLIHGITAELFKLLRPHIIVLPETTPININSASAPVLMAISKQLSLTQAQEIIEYRNSHHGFISTDEFLNLPSVRAGQISANKVTLISNYFLVQSNVSVMQQELATYSLLKRSKISNRIQVDVLWQSKGSW